MNKYTRVFTDKNGESHFEDVDVNYSAVNFAPPAPPFNISEFSEAKRFCFGNAPLGWSGDWHPTPKKQYFIYLAGKIEAQVSDGEIRVFGPGSVTLLEDTTGKGHRSKVVGDEEVYGLIIQLED